MLDAPMLDRSPAHAVRPGRPHPVHPHPGQPVRGAFRARGRGDAGVAPGRPRRWLAVGTLALAAVAVACGGDDEAEPVGGGAPAGAGAASARDAAAGDASAGGDAGPAAGAAEHRFELREEEQEMAQRLQEAFPRLDVFARSLDLREFAVALPPDGIPAIDDPRFVAPDAADAWLDDREPVVVVALGGEARAYPLQILTWHEIVNDVFDDVPVAVTFCPLCNSALAFDRRVEGETRTFGVSGLLRRSDLVMFDRTHHSLWQQIGGEALVGADTGRRLERIAAPIVSYGEFKEAHPGAVVLSRETGHGRDYGQNPYVYYDRTGATLFPVPEYEQGVLDAKERVLTVEEAGEAIAFPFSVLAAEVVREVSFRGRPIVAFWQPGAVSALDDFYILGSRNVGAAGAYEPQLDGERLTFVARDGVIVDTGTGSTWNVLGVATAGPLAGRSLPVVVSGSHFWFAWSVFQPQTAVVTPLAGGS